MEQSLTFARRFARLVWVLLYESRSSDAQLAALRALASDPRSAAVHMQLADGRLTAGSVPVPWGTVGVPELVAQLDGHSVRDIVVEPASSAADLLFLARLVATVPAAGDGGAAFGVRLAMFDIDGVRVRTLASEARHATPTVAPTSSHVTPTWGAPVVGARGSERAATTASATPPGGHPTLLGAVESAFQRLDSATSSQEASTPLDWLARLASEALSRDRPLGVLEILHGLAERERSAGKEEVRHAIGDAIDQFSVPSVLRPLAGLLARQRDAGGRCMVVLERAREAGATVLIDAMAAATTMRDRRAFFDALLALPTGVATILHQLRDERWYVVRNAADLIGEKGLVQAEEMLIEMLEERDARVRNAAATALAKLGTASAVKAMRGGLRDASPSARERAAEALTNAMLERTATPLISALDREDDPRVQVALVTALGQLATPEAVAELVRLARGGIPTNPVPTAVRTVAVEALGRTGTESAMEAVRALQRDRARDVRGAAAWVLLGRHRTDDPSAADGDRADDERGEAISAR